MIRESLPKVQILNFYKLANSSFMPTMLFYASLFFVAEIISLFCIFGFCMIYGIYGLTVTISLAYTYSHWLKMVATHLIMWSNKNGCTT